MMHAGAARTRAAPNDPLMRDASVVLRHDAVIGDTDPRLFGAFVEHLGRCIYGGSVRAGPPERGCAGLSRRRARPGARARPDGSALSRRQLRLRLPLGRRRRAARGSPPPARSARGCRPRPTRSAPTSSSTGVAPPPWSRCSPSISAPAAATTRAGCSNTATTRAAPRSRTCAPRTAGRHRTTSGSGASATRWTARGRWRPRAPTSTVASPPKRPR